MSNLHIEAAPNWKQVEVFLDVSMCGLLVWAWYSSLQESKYLPLPQPGNNNGELALSIPTDEPEDRVELTPIKKHTFVCAAKEYCLGGQMELVDGKRMYADMLDAFTGKANKAFMEKLLGVKNPMGSDLQNYLDAHGGKLPTKLPSGVQLYIPVSLGDMGRLYMDLAKDYWGDNINLDGGKVVAATWGAWQANTDGVRTYIQGLKGIEGAYSAGQQPGEKFGFGKDEDGYLVFAMWSGVKAPRPAVAPIVFGGKTGNEVSPENIDAATAKVKTLLYVLKNMPLTPKRVSTPDFALICTIADSECAGVSWDTIRGQGYFSSPVDNGALR